MAHEYLKKFGKSIAYSSLNVLQELTPWISGTATNVADVARDGRDLAQRAKATIRDQKRLYERVPLIRQAKRLYDEALDDFRTGNLSLEKHVDYYDDSVGDLYDDYDDNPDEDAIEGDEDYISPEVDSTNRVGKAVIASTRAQLRSDAAIGSMIASSNMKSSKLNADQVTSTMLYTSNMTNQALTSINRNLEGINSNLVEMMRFQQDNVGVTNRAMMDFMDRTLQALDNMSQGSRMPHQRKSNKKWWDNGEILFNDDMGFDPKEYAKLIKKNFANSSLGTTLGMLKVGASMGMQQMDDTRLSKMGLETILKAIIPKQYKKGLEYLDTTFKTGIDEALYRLGDLGNYGSGAGQIGQMIGEIFGKKRDDLKNRIYMSNYHKDEMPWNGLAQKALVTVIPEHLANIEKFLNPLGQKHVFDYARGQFVNEDDISKVYDDRLKSIARSNIYSVKDTIETKMGTSGIGSNAQKKLNKDLTDLFHKYTRREISATEFKKQSERRMKAIMPQQEVQYILTQWLDAANTTIRDYNRFYENITKPETNQDSIFQHGDLYFNNEMSRQNRKSSRGELFGESFNREKLDQMLLAIGYKGDVSKDIINIFRRGDKPNASSDENLALQERIENAIKAEELANETKSRFQNFYDKHKLDRFKLGRMAKKKYDEYTSKDDDDVELYDNFLYSAASAVNSMLYGTTPDTNTRIGKVYNAARNKFSRSPFGNMDSFEDMIFKQELYALDHPTKQQEKVGRTVASEISASVRTGAEEAATQTQADFDRQSQKNNNAIDQAAGGKIKPNTETAEVVQEIALNIQASNLQTIENSRNTVRAINEVVNKLDEQNDTMNDSMEQVKETSKTFMDKLFNNDDAPFHSVKLAASDKFKEAKRTFTGKGYTDSKGNVIADEYDPSKSVVGVLNSVGAGIADNFWTFFDGDDYKKSQDSLYNKLHNTGGAIADATNDVADNIRERGEEAVNDTFGNQSPQNKQSALKNVLGAMNKKFAENADGIKKGAAAGGAGAIIGGLGAMALGHVLGPFGMFGSMMIGGPIGGAILGTAGGILSQSKKFKDYMFGPKDEDGKRLGGLISKETQQSFKKAIPTIIGGAALGVGAKALFSGISSATGAGVLGSALLPGGIISAAVIGTGAALMHNSDTFRNILFGDSKEGEEKKSIGKKVTEGWDKLKSKFPNIGKSAKNGAKGLGLGVTAGALLPHVGLIGGALSAAGPVGFGLAGLGMGIASSTEKFNRLMFGDEEYEEVIEVDENGQQHRVTRPTGKRSSGIMGQIKNMLVVNAIDPIKQEFRMQATKTAWWIKEKVEIPLRLIFNPIKEAGDTIVDGVKEKLDMFGDGLLHIVKGIGSGVFGYMTNKFGRYGKAAMKAGGMGLRLGGSILASPLNVVAGIVAPKESKNRRAVKKDALARGKEALKEKWADEGTGFFGRMADKIGLRFADDAEGSGSWMNYVDYDSARGKIFQAYRDKHSYKKGRKHDVNQQKQWYKMDRARKAIAKERGYKEMPMDEDEIAAIRKKIMRNGGKTFNSGNDDYDMNDYLKTEEDINDFIYHKDRWLKRVKDDVKKKKDEAAGIVQTPLGGLKLVKKLDENGEVVKDEDGNEVTEEVYEGETDVERKVRTETEEYQDKSLDVAEESKGILQGIFDFITNPKKIKGTKENTESAEIAGVNPQPDEGESSEIPKNGAPHIVGSKFNNFNTKDDLPYGKDPVEVLNSIAKGVNETKDAVKDGTTQTAEVKTAIIDQTESDREAEEKAEHKAEINQKKEERKNREHKEGAHAKALAYDPSKETKKDESKDQETKTEKADVDDKKSKKSGGGFLDLLKNPTTWKVIGGAATAAAIFQDQIGGLFKTIGTFVTDTALPAIQKWAPIVVENVANFATNVISNVIPEVANAVVDAVPKFIKKGWDFATNLLSNNGKTVSETQAQFDKEAYGINSVQMADGTWYQGSGSEYEIDPETGKTKKTRSGLNQGLLYMGRKVLLNPEYGAKYGKTIGKTIGTVGGGIGRKIGGAVGSKAGGAVGKVAEVVTGKTKFTKIMTKLASWLEGLKSSKVLGKAFNKIPNGAQTFIDNIIKCLTDGAAKVSEKQAAKASAKLMEAEVESTAKTTGGAATAGLLTAIFTAYDAVSGAFEADRLFNVSGDEVDWLMRAISSGFKALLGFGYAPVFDVALEVLSDITKTDLKCVAASAIYKIFMKATGQEDKVQELEENQQQLALECEIYNYEHGTNLTVKAYSELKNPTVAESAWNAVKTLFGKGKKTDFATYEDRAKAMMAERQTAGTSSLTKSTETTASATVDYSEKYTSVGMNKFSTGYGTGPNSKGSKVIGYGPAQADPRWASFELGKFADGRSSTMATSGCGPTALAQVAGKDPLSVAKMAKNSGYIQNGGSTSDLMTTGAKKLGLNPTTVNNNYYGALANGDSVILAGKGNRSINPFTNAGHIVSATGLDANGNILINDPMTGTTQSYSKSAIDAGLTQAWSYGKKPSGYGRGGKNVIGYGENGWHTGYNQQSGEYTFYTTGGVKGRSKYEMIGPGTISDTLLKDEKTYRIVKYGNHMGEWYAEILDPKKHKEYLAQSTMTQAGLSQSFSKYNLGNTLDMSVLENAASINKNAPVAPNAFQNDSIMQAAKNAGKYSIKQAILDAYATDAKKSAVLSNIFTKTEELPNSIRKDVKKGKDIDGLKFVYDDSLPGGVGYQITDFYKYMSYLHDAKFDEAEGTLERYMQALGAKYGYDKVNEVIRDLRADGRTDIALLKSFEEVYASGKNELGVWNPKLLAELTQKYGADHVLPGGRWFYSANEEEWANLPWMNGTVATQGADVVSLAMLLSSATGKAITPKYLIENVLPRFQIDTNKYTSLKNYFSTLFSGSSAAKPGLQFLPEFVSSVSKDDGVGDGNWNNYTDEQISDLQAIYGSMDARDFVKAFDGTSNIKPFLKGTLLQKMNTEEVINQVKATPGDYLMRVQPYAGSPFGGTKNPDDIITGTFNNTIFGTLTGAASADGTTAGMIMNPYATDKESGAVTSDYSFLGMKVGKNKDISTVGSPAWRVTLPDGTVAMTDEEMSQFNSQISSYSSGKKKSTATGALGILGEILGKLTNIFNRKVNTIVTGDEYTRILDDKGEYLQYQDNEGNWQYEYEKGATDSSGGTMFTNLNSVGNYSGSTAYGGTNKTLEQLINNPSSMEEQVIGRVLQLGGTVEAGNNYAAVNPNDNGSLSVGIMQWHAGRAKDLLNNLANRLPNASDQQKARSYASMATRALSSSEASGLANFLSSSSVAPYNQAQQNELMIATGRDNINGALKLYNEGYLKNPRSIIVAGDIANTGPGLIPGWADNWKKKDLVNITKNNEVDAVTNSLMSADSWWGRQNGQSRYYSAWMNRIQKAGQWAKALPTGTYFGMGESSPVTDSPSAMSQLNKTSSDVSTLLNQLSNVGTAKLNSLLKGTDYKTELSDIMSGTSSNTSSTGATGFAGNMLNGGADDKNSSVKDWFTSKLNARVTSDYGKRTDPFGSGSTKFHGGIDFGANGGTPIPTDVAGTIVSNSYDENGFGNYVIVQDAGGDFHYFAHMQSKSPLAVGTHVEKGDIVGYVGTTGSSTGNHLHYEIRRGNKDRNSRIDPNTFKIPVSQIGGNPEIKHGPETVIVKKPDTVYHGEGDKNDNSQFADKLALAVNTDNIEEKMNLMISALQDIASNTKQSQKQQSQPVSFYGNGNKTTNVTNAPVVVNAGQHKATDHSKLSLRGIHDLIGK